MREVCFAGSRIRRSLSRSVFSISSVCLFGCVYAGSGVWLGSAYAQDSQADKATIVIESVSNSLATRGKNIVVTYYQDEECSRRGKTDKVFKKNYVDDLHAFNPLNVETDSPFIFQVSYLEKRRGETRSCAAISNVNLQPNRSYKAIFKIVDEVVGCNISVFDVTDIVQANQVPDSVPEISLLEVPMVDAKPEFTCRRVGKKSYKSGTPVYSYKDRLG